MDVFAIFAIAVLAVCAVFLGWVYFRIASANRQHWRDVGYQRRGLFLDRPPKDSGAPWVFADREKKARKPQRKQDPK